LPLFPEQASTVAGQVDALYYFLVAVSVFFSTLIFLLVFYFAIKYRRRSEAEMPVQIHGSLRLELLWTIIPFCLAMVMFAWGARLYFVTSRPPADALEIQVIGKQWMWKFQHPTGQREINELHVPLGQPVKLTMASEDVIHSLYVPAFRIKRDVLPGRYTSAWFEATKIGTYHLFCAEYCGTEHSLMGGQVIVMAPMQYQNWLSGGTSGESPISAGERRFQQLGCNTCHRAEAEARGPALAELFGKTVQLQSGETVVADEAYIRESILNPKARMVLGYQPLMPTYQGLISEEGVLQLIAYIKSLGK
jgi:cytochrome c oxidase subunit 2